MSFKIEEQNIDFSMKKDAEIPAYFWGDPKRLEQILLNLVNNAMKFTKDGAVSVSIRVVACVRDTYTLEFSIKDTGIGMTKEQIEQLFIPFNQADSSINRRFGGTGLGLSIVHNLVELMDGSIKVFSEPGEGSTFNIQLTLESDRNKEYEKNRKNASIYFQNIRVLVLEKNVFYMNLLKDYLESFSMIAEFVQSEAAAIRLMEEACRPGGKPYDLLIVDMDTPEDGGINFCRRLKKLPVICLQPKTILLIPVSREDLFDQLDAAGLDSGVTKPIIPSVLYNAIVEIFKLNVLEILDNETFVKDPEEKISDYPCNILIVEDNKTNQFIAKSILEQAGMAVVLADNGKEGADYFLSHPGEIQLILMDLHMPVMDGFEATKLIREKDRKVPVIAMTADAITGVEENCRIIGIDHYISKPFEPDNFVETVKRVLESNASTEASLAVKVLDIEAGVKSVGGNKELYLKILDEYYNENRDVAKQLDTSIAGGDLREAAQIVHKIKSSSGSIGAKGLYEVCISLQKALGDGDTQEIGKLQAEFDNLLSEVLNSIKKG
ncbi:MAG: response regulator [Clostridiales bacterium]|nr:response regulator [Clostridiales bacterium]